MSPSQINSQLLVQQPRAGSHGGEREAGAFDRIHARVRDERPAADDNLSKDEEAVIVAALQADMLQREMVTFAVAASSAKYQALQPQEADVTGGLAATLQGARPEASRMQSVAAPVEASGTRVPIRSTDTDAHTVHRGTLPVIVAGQLVELSVLRERRLSRDGAPVRRLAMRIGDGVLGIAARVQSDRLVIEFDGPARSDAVALDACAKEVQHLARRLGWRFTVTEWGA